MNNMTIIKKLIKSDTVRSRVTSAYKCFNVIFCINGKKGAFFSHNYQAILTFCHYNNSTCISSPAGKALHRPRAASVVLRKLNIFNPGGRKDPLEDEVTC